MAKNKIERIDQEIEKTREKIAEYQEKLKTLGELYYQVQHFRGTKRSPYRTLVE